MPKLQAAVPAGAPPNALLRVRLPDGNEVNVRVPDGLKAGDEFIFEVSSIGEITSSTPANTTTSSSSGGGGKGKKGDRKSTKNPKKKRSNQSSHADNTSSNKGGGGDQFSSATSQQPFNNNVVRGPTLMGGCISLYNAVYDMLTSNSTTTSPTTTSSPSPTSLSRKQSRDNASPQSAQSSPQQKQFASAQVTNLSKVGFLDRELTNGRDFLTALGVGIFIGLSIVMGFLAGVLYVTPIEKD